MAGAHRLGPLHRLLVGAGDRDTAISMLVPALAVLKTISRSRMSLSDPAPVDRA